MPHQVGSVYQASGRELLSSILAAAGKLQESDDEYLETVRPDLKEVDDILWSLVDG